MYPVWSAIFGLYLVRDWPYLGYDWTVINSIQITLCLLWQIESVDPIRELVRR